MSRSMLYNIPMNGLLTELIHSHTNRLIDQKSSGTVIHKCTCSCFCVFLFFFFLFFVFLLYDKSISLGYLFINIMLFMYCPSLFV